MPVSFVSYRRLASILSAACVMAVLAAAPAAAQLCGDADGNGDVSVTDGVRALQAVAGIPDRCDARCDLDGDGRTSLSDGVNVLRLAADLSAFTACPVLPGLVLTPVASGLTAPLFLTAAPGDPASRLFVVEQGGRIVVVENGTVLSRAFLDITGLTSKGGEQGLLGLAFHPDYAQNRRFFIYYTDADGDVVIAEYLRSAGDATLAEPTATRLLRMIEHPFSNHNGGMIAFGPDGFLYAGSGDGGGGGDPGENAQDPQSKLGKVLRLNVDGDTTPPGNLPGADPDVWDLGLRNPFRLSFDRQTGDLYIGDVGQGRFEEVDVEPRGQGNKNYGWDVTEGFECFEPQNGCDTTGITFPAVAYAHDNGGEIPDCSVIGGYVYRGSAIPTLQGRYLYGDVCSNRVRSFVWNGSAAVSQVEATAELASDETVGAIASFGEDLNGELYVVDLSGTIFRIDPQP